MISRRSIALLRGLLLGNGVDRSNADAHSNSSDDALVEGALDPRRDSLSLAQARQDRRRQSAEHITCAILEILDLDDDLTDDQRDRAAANLTSSFFSIDPTNGIDDSIDVERCRRVAADLESFLGLDAGEAGTMDPRRDSLQVAWRRQRRQRAADDLASSILSIAELEDSLSTSTRRRAANNLTSSLMAVDPTAIAMVVEEDAEADAVGGTGRGV